MTRRSWIKIHCDKWLRGSIRQEPAFIRAIFVDLIAMAGDSAYGNEGIIKLAENVGFTDEVLAGIIKVTKKEWQTAKKSLSDGPEPRIEIIELSSGYAIKIINWSKYQSEYNRQKSYRQSYKQRYNDYYQKGNKVEGEGEREGEGDIEKKENIKNINTLALNDADASNSEPMKRPEKVKINFDFSLRAWENITDEDIFIWEKAYPAVDITQELSKMADWLLSNPDRKKKNYRRFITNWLSRAQERGGSRGGKQMTASRVGEHKEKYDYPPGYWEKFRELMSAGLSGKELTNELKKLFPEYYKKLGLEDDDGGQKEKSEYPEGYWEKAKELRTAGFTGEALTNELKKYFPNFFQGEKNV